MKYKMEKTQVISITSGKGGVGKTSTVTNLSYRLAQLGKRVLILDGDLGMANVDIMFGVKPRGTILDVVSGEKQIHEILTEAAKNIHIIPGGSGLFELTQLNAFQRRAILDAAMELTGQYDYLLVDTAPGISENVLYLNSAVDQVTVIVTPDPSSVADSYALIKVLMQKYRVSRYQILCNQVKDEVEGFGLYRRFSEVCLRFLDLSLDYAGSIPADPVLRRSTQHQRLIMRHEPHCAASLAIGKIAQTFVNNTEFQRESGGLPAFWNQLVGVA